LLRERAALLHRQVLDLRCHLLFRLSSRQQRGKQPSRPEGDQACRERVSLGPPPDLSGAALARSAAEEADLASVSFAEEAVELTDPPTLEARSAVPPIILSFIVVIAERVC